MAPSEPRQNRLAAETSPYLRQHSANPVDWYPFGDEAFERARALDRPLFISIGYSTCHWCHVMAHESFEDEETAAEMNRSLVSVKVDREEHPEVDAVYMEAVLAATGSGGWPMSVFATPEGRPFFAGTYFPKTPSGRMPAFGQVVAAVVDVWANRRADVEAQAEALSAAVSARLSPRPADPASGGPPAALTRPEVRSATLRACERLGETADPLDGGFGTQPKFPQPLLVDLLLRAEATGVGPKSGPRPLDLALSALEAMASGGIYDHVGGGFARYSVDRRWLVPHFEKMLYDQALLARAYLHAWQLTGDARWRQVVVETLSYVLGRLAHPSGALCSAEDADSEGEEGRYYLWSASELAAAVGPELAEGAAAFYGVTESGNFEGRNILHRPERGDLLRPPEIEQARARLAARRSGRVPPALDDKVLFEWNAMACSVMAEAAAATGDGELASAAERIAGVLLEARRRNGSLTPRCLAAPGRAPIPGVAADVAWLAEASVRLFELTGRLSYLESARDLARELEEGYVDRETGTVFTARRGAESPVVRAAELHDGVTPCAASVAAVALARLFALTSDAAVGDLARRVFLARRAVLEEAPVALPELLAAGELLTGGSIEIAATGTGRRLLEGARRRFLPTAVFAWLGDGEAPSAAPLPVLEGRAADALHVCREGACRLPAREPGEVDAELDAVVHALASGGT